MAQVKFDSDKVTAQVAKLTDFQLHLLMRIVHAENNKRDKLFAEHPLVEAIGEEDRI